MYRNHIRPGTKRQPQFFIPLSDIEYEIEKREYVEFVCDILIQGRYGLDRVEPVCINLRDRPEPAAAYLFDLTDDREIVPYHILPSLGRSGYQDVEVSFLKAKQIGLTAQSANRSDPTANIRSNQGRGSP